MSNLSNLALPDAACAAIVALTQLPSASPHDTAAATVHERAHSWTPDVTIVDADDVAALAGHGTTLDRVSLRDGTNIPATAAFLKAPVIPRSCSARVAARPSSTKGGQGRMANVMAVTSPTPTHRQ